MWVLGGLAVAGTLTFLLNALGFLGISDVNVPDWLPSQCSWL
jgi:hypothetical protein